MPNYKLRICVICGKGFQPRDAKRKTCYNDECIEAQKATWGSIIFNCETCGKEFRVSPYELKHPRQRPPRFCSNKCYGAWKTTIRGSEHPLWKPRVEKECLTCGITFEVKQHAAEKAKFCSISCKSIWTVTHNSTVSSTELVVAEELDRRGVSYDHQVFRNGCVPDFVIGKTILEVDGDYWHTLPGIPEQDQRKDAVHRKNGYEVIRIWEHEVEQGDFSKLNALCA